MILHAGDIYVPVCLDWQGAIAPVYAVEMLADAQFKEDSRVVDKRRVLSLEGHTISLIHDLLVRVMAQEVTELTLPIKAYPPGRGLI